MIRMKKLLPLLFLISHFQFVFSQPLRTVENYPLVIDTDCGITDFRAINLLLSRPEVKISAFIISGGIDDPWNGLTKLTGFLHENNNDSIPAGIGKAIKVKSKDTRSIDQSLSWSSSPAEPEHAKTSLALLSEILSSPGKKITYICLGPLTGMAELISLKPGLISCIDRIIWYNDHVVPSFRGFNFEYDSLSVKKVLSSGIRIDIISSLDNQEAVFDTSFFLSVSDNSGGLTGILRSFYMRNNKNGILSKQRSVMEDELAAVYLFNSSLFDMNPLPGMARIRYNTGYNLPAVKEVISDMILGTYYNENNIVLSKFPAEREMFSYDVRQITDSAIARYGSEEWKACVITDEFHGHLGVYSIVGAKMGIKAREIFGVGPDVLEVVSYAGLKPPYSCLNDGIQVSTGSTLGMGLISVAPVKQTRAMADFSYKGRTVRISLKDEYLEKVESDINEGIVKFGLMDDGYWKLIRQSALHCWLEWDRNEIFDMEEVSFRK